MSKKFADKKCVVCNQVFSPNSGIQKYCKVCSKIKDAERKKQWYIKNNPDAYKERPKECTVCSEPISAYYEGKPYCNKHYLRLYHNGTLEKKIRPKNKYVIEDSVVKMYTHKGEEFLIDLEDLDEVSKYSWCLNKSGGYLVANIDKKVKRLHRFILGVANPKQLIDHINGNVLDNRKENLRLCDTKQNTRNCRISKNNTSGYPGVGITPSGRWRSRITVDRKEIRLGTFDTFEDAKKARIEAEIKYFGEFAPSLNVIE